MTEQSKLPENHGDWWLSNQGAQVGPYSEAYIVAGVKTGIISTETCACPVNTQEWKPLYNWPAFTSVCTTVISPPPPLSAATARSAAAPWNPRVIAWLGLLFSPVWMGIMVAVNARRLHAGLHIWRPVVIGIGATVLDVFILAMVFDWYIFELALYLSTIWLIWRLDLRRQINPFDTQKANTG